MPKIYQCALRKQTPADLSRLSGSTGLGEASTEGQSVNLVERFLSCFPRWGSTAVAVRRITTADGGVGRACVFQLFMVEGVKVEISKRCQKDGGCLADWQTTSLLLVAGRTEPGHPGFWDLANWATGGH
jgi:hypothetical protein